MKLATLVLGAIALTATVSAQTSGGLHVYDSTGKVIGNYLVTAPCNVLGPAFGGPCGDVAVVSIGTSAIVISVSGRGFAQRYITDFFHTTTDCSGPRLILGDYGDPDLLPAPSMFSAATNRLIVPVGPTLTVTALSYEDMGGVTDPGPPGTCRSTSRTSSMYLTIPVDASLVGTPPFSVH